jgi:hypothetical protein
VHLATNRKGLAYPFFQKRKKGKRNKSFFFFFPPFADASINMTMGRREEPGPAKL